MWLLGGVLLSLFLPSYGFKCSDTKLFGDIEQPVVPFQPNTTCSFMVFLDNSAISSAFIEVEITANSMGPGDEVTIAGMYDNIRSQDAHLNFNFHAAMPQQVIIKISSSANSTMCVGYWFTKQPFPAVGKTVKLTDKQFGIAGFIQTKTLNVGDLYEVSATNQVALSAAAPTTTSQYDFLNVFVFDGTGNNKQLLGSVYGAQNRILLSHSTTATLMYVMQADDSFVGTIIANDDGNLDSCLPYTVAWINPSDIINGYYQTTLDATSDTPCITLLNNADGTNSPYLVGVTQDDHESVYSINGAPGGPQVAVYRNTKTNLPQYYPGFARTFTALQGTPVLNFTFDPVLANDHVPYGGRKGFFMTKNFGYFSSDQSTSFYLNSTAKFNFTFQVTNSASVPGALMNVYGTKGLLQKIDLSNVSTSVYFSFVDTLIDLDINDGIYLNPGYFVTYTVTDVAKDQISCPSGPTNLFGNQYLPIGVIPPNFNCSFVFLLQAHDLADLTVNSYNIGTDEKVEIQYLDSGAINNGKSSNFSIHAAFPPTKVTILVQSGATTNMHFGYNVTRKSIVFDTNPKILSARSNETAQFIQLTSTLKQGSVFVVETDTDLSLISSSPSSSPPLQFLNIFVFLGMSSAAPVVSTLYDLYKQPNFVLSQGVQIVYAMAVPDLFGAVVANAASNLKNCPNYKVQWSFEDFVPNGPNPPSPYQLTVDATQQTTCMTIVNGLSANIGYYAPYFKSVNVSGSSNSAPQVLIGAPILDPIGAGTLLGTLANPATFSLPQYFPGFVRTIILTSGVLKINLSFDPTDDDVSKFKFTFAVAKTNAPSDATVTIYGTLPDPLQVIYLSNNANWGQNFTYTDSLIAVTLDGGSQGVQNLGTMLQYSVAAADTTITTPSTTKTTTITTTTNPAVPVTTPTTTTSTTTPPSNGGVTSQNPSGSTEFYTTPVAMTTTTTTRTATTISGLMSIIFVTLFL